MRLAWLPFAAALVLTLASCGTVEIHIETKVPPMTSGPLPPSATRPVTAARQTPTTPPSATIAASAEVNETMVTLTAPSTESSTTIPPASTTTAPATTTAPPTRTTRPLPSATPCPPWFFEPPPADCAAAHAVRLEGAAQEFERGFMLWTAAPDQFLVFLRDSRRYLVIAAPYTTAEGQVLVGEPPAGAQAPVSGFSLVWLGQIAPGEAGFADLPTQLGWAVEAERAFATDYQCQVAAGGNQGGCYLRDPAGAIVRLIPAGAWTYVDSQGQSGSLAEV